MAGAFTHMAIVSEATKSFQAGKQLGDVLRTHKNYLTLGSVSPDIPYLAHLALGGFAWADIMHYHQTNKIVQNAVHSLAVAKTKSKVWRSQLAWLLGFVGHLVSDASIHPIVESIVGPYTDKDTNANHSECEMIQDVFIMKEVLNLELADAEYTDLLKTSFENPLFEKVSEFWSQHIQVNCPMFGEFPVQAVIKSYIKELDTAEGGNAFARAFRHFGLKLIYRTYEDITKNSPELVEKYYANVKLPNGLTGPFKKEGFDFTVKNVVAVWSKIERSLFTKDNITDFVANWNLDTGVDQESNKSTYWS